MKISTIIPSFNQGKYIAEALDSVISQGVDGDIIIVDGKSSDNTEKIVADFISAHPDSRITWLSKKDTGISQAMNRGLAMAKGDIIHFLACDETVQPNAYRIALTFFEKVDYLAGAVNFIDAEGRYLWTKYDINPSYEDMMTFKKLPSFASSFFSREIFNRYSFDETLTVNPDMDLFGRMWNETRKKFISTPLINYRIQPGSWSCDWRRADTVAEARRKIVARYVSRDLWGSACRNIERDRAQTYLDSGRFVSAFRIFALAGNLRGCLSCVKRFLMSIDKSFLRRAFTRWKYRFDLGWQFMTLLNLALLVISASGPLMGYMHLRRLWYLVFIMVAFGFAGVLIFGLFLDKVVRYTQAYNDETTVRNQYWDLLMSRLDKIEAVIKK